MFQSDPNSRSPYSGIIGLLVGGLVLFVLFKVFSIVFALLWKYVTPAALIASLVIDHKVFLGYVNNLYKLFERNWVYGLVGGALSFIFLPFVALYLLGTALFKRRVTQARDAAEQRINGELIDYEEVDSEPLDLETPFEELPPPPERPRSKGSEYDNLF